MVVPGGVEGEVSEYFSGGGVDDFDVVVLDEDQDAGSVVDAADADVVEASVDAQGDVAGFADAVGADAFVGVDAGCWVGFGSAGVDRGGGGEGEGEGGGTGRAAGAAAKAALKRAGAGRGLGTATPAAAAARRRAGMSGPGAEGQGRWGGAWAGGTGRRGAGGGGT